MMPINRKEHDCQYVNSYRTAGNAVQLCVVFGVQFIVLYYFIRSDYVQSVCYKRLVLFHDLAAVANV